jgi:hypothetical protein
MSVLTLCRPLKKPRLSIQDDQMLLDNGSPVELADCRTGADQVAGQMNDLVLSESGKMTWASYSRSFSQDDNMNYEQNLGQNPVQKFTSDISLSPHPECTREDTLNRRLYSALRLPGFAFASFTGFWRWRCCFSHSRSTIFWCSS